MKRFHSPFPRFLSVSSLAAISLSAVSTPVLTADEPGHFESVDAHLEQGGVIYGFVDIDGDLRRVTKGLTNLWSEVYAMQDMTMPLPIPAMPLDAVFVETGIAEVQAFGLSSTRRGTGFHNRAFILTEGAPSKLLTLGGSENLDFEVFQRAPSGVDVVVEQSLDISEALQFARTAGEVIFGPGTAEQVDAFLEMPIPESPLVVGEVLSALEGRSYFFAMIDDDETMHLPELGEVSRFEFLLRVESAADIVVKLVELAPSEQFPNLSVESQGGWLTVRGFSEEATLAYEELSVRANTESGEVFVV